VSHHFFLAAGVQSLLGYASLGSRSKARQNPAGEIMPKYLCLQRSLVGGNASSGKPSPAQMQEMYEKFNEWRQKFEKNLVDLGGRLGQGKLALPDPAPDGPFVEVKELVGGYMVVSAADLDEAIQVARECPGLMHPGSGVEVIEIRTPG
jgi:hypothetical protein